MYRLLCFIAALCLAGVTTDDFKQCLKLMEFNRNNSSCCKQEPIKKEIKDMDSKEHRLDRDKYKECEDLSDDGEECSKREMCMAKKSGLMKDNGDIDKEAMKDIMRDEMKPIMEDNVYIKMEECIDGDLSKFEADSCYFRSLGRCIEIHFIINCGEWSDDNSCSEMKAAADECAKMLS